MYIYSMSIVLFVLFFIGLAALIVWGIKETWNYKSNKRYLFDKNNNQT